MSRHAFLFGLILFADTALASRASFGSRTRHNHPLVKICSKECPDATDEKTIQQCVIQKAEDTDFMKSACGIATSKHELLKENKPGSKAHD